MLKIYLVLVVLLFNVGCETSTPVSIIDKPVPIENRTDRIWKQGWISVSENRLKSTSNFIELPFILSKTSDSISLNSTPVLIMSGGPGNSSLNMANGVVHTQWGEKRDIIVLDQRGTGNSIPALFCPEIDSLKILGLNKGYWGKSLDSLKLLGVKMCYEKFAAQNIDFSGYNTLEIVEDIEDLRKALKLDKIILYGMSYSCNLMTTYAQTYPQNTEALILDSPLPHQVNYDEEAYQNIDSTLIKIIKHYSGSTDLYLKWEEFISLVKDSVFNITLNENLYRYTKNELIDIVIFKMSAHNSLPETTVAIDNIINGNHAAIEDIINYYLSPSNQALGMRYSLWVSEELSQEQEAVIQEQGEQYTWLHNYAANDVSFVLSRTWKVASMYEQRQWPKTNYDGRVLILSGQFDPWTPEWYGKRMLEYLPNATHITYPGNSHLPGFTDKGIEDINEFLDATKR